MTPEELRQYLDALNRCLDGHVALARASALFALGRRRHA